MFHTSKIIYCFHSNGNKSFLQGCGVFRVIFRLLKSESLKKKLGIAVLVGMNLPSALIHDIKIVRFRFTTAIRKFIKWGIDNFMLDVLLY